MTFLPSLGTAAVAGGQEKFLLPSVVLLWSFRKNLLEYLIWMENMNPAGTPMCWKLVHSSN